MTILQFLHWTNTGADTAGISETMYVCAGGNTVGWKPWTWPGKAEDPISLSKSISLSVCKSPALVLFKKPAILMYSLLAVNEKKVEKSYKLKFSNRIRLLNQIYENFIIIKTRTSSSLYSITDTLYKITLQNKVCSMCVWCSIYQKIMIMIYKN